MRIVLVESRREGLTFEEAWFRALRQLVPPPGCPAGVRAEHESDKRLWREVKEHWRAAYEGREPGADGLARGMADARRRLRDVLEADARRLWEADAQRATLRVEARRRGLEDSGSATAIRRRIAAWETARELAEERERLGRSVA